MWGAVSADTCASCLYFIINVFVWPFSEDGSGVTTWEAYVKDTSVIRYISFFFQNRILHSLFLGIKVRFFLSFTSFFFQTPAPDKHPSTPSQSFSFTSLPPLEGTPLRRIVKEEHHYFRSPDTPRRLKRKIDEKSELLEKARKKLKAEK